MASKNKTPKQRNPIALSPIMRKGGTHQKSYKANRKKFKMDLKRQIEKLPQEIIGFFQKAFQENLSNASQYITALSN